ncbi:MAG: hypothetical protein ABJC04_13200 [Verrucomicrobiota bacterium]
MGEIIRDEYNSLTGRVCLGTVTRRMERERAVELALINGRSAQDVSKADWEQAKRELTCPPDTDPKNCDA